MDKNIKHLKWLRYSLSPLLFFLAGIFSHSYGQDNLVKEKDKIENNKEAKKIIKDADDFDSYVQRPFDEDPTHISDKQQNFINKYNITDPDITDIYNVEKRDCEKDCLIENQSSNKDKPRIQKKAQRAREKNKDVDC